MTDEAAKCGEGVYSTDEAAKCGEGVPLTDEAAISGKAVLRPTKHKRRRQS